MAQIIIWNSYNEPVNLVRPVGPYILANWLRQHGYTAKVIDFCHAIPTEKLVEITSKHIDTDTVAIGVSSTFWKDTQYSNRQRKDYYDNPTHDYYYEPDWVIQARIMMQSKNPRLEWLLGGHPGVGRVGKQKKFPWIQFTGFAEDSLLKFMKEKTNKDINYPLFDIKHLTGCFSPDDSIHPSESLPIELARGCQFKCKFCSYPLVGKKTDSYIRDEKYIEDELIRNYELFGTTRYQIMDDTVNESATKLERLVNIVQRLPFKFEWVGYNRLDLIGVHRHTIDLLKASGLKSAYFGIESFHPEASTCLGKGWNGKYGKDFLIELRELWGDDIHMTCSFIAGLPYETADSLRETQDWLIETKVVDTWFFLQLFLNKNAGATEFERNASAYGIRFPDPHDNDYWEHDNSNFHEAIKMCGELNYDPRRLEMVRPMTWYIPSYASLGYDYDTVCKTKVVDLNWKMMAIRHKLFIMKYIKDQLNY